MTKTGTFGYLGHLFRMQELDPCRKLTVLKPEGTRGLGKPNLRWFDSVEEYLKNTGVRNCRQVTGPRTVEDNFERD